MSGSTIAAINCAIHLPELRRQSAQAKLDVARRKQKDKDLNKLAKEFLRLKSKDSQ